MAIPNLSRSPPVRQAHDRRPTVSPTWTAPASGTGSTAAAIRRPWCSRTRWEPISRCGTRRSRHSPAAFASCATTLAATARRRPRPDPIRSSASAATSSACSTRWTSKAHISAAFRWVASPACGSASMHRNVCAGWCSPTPQRGSALRTTGMPASKRCVPEGMAPFADRAGAVVHARVHRRRPDTVAAMRLMMRAHAGGRLRGMLRGRARHGPAGSHLRDTRAHAGDCRHA